MSNSKLLYDPSYLHEYPIRNNLHDRHKFTAKDDLLEIFKTSFLHPMLPQNYVSRVPAPENAVKETRLQYPWQTPSRWAYPAQLTYQVDKDMVYDDEIPRDPNDSNGIPDVADEECLKRANIPWDKLKGTKVYLKVIITTQNFR